LETLLLIAAEAREFAGFRRRCRDEEKLSWPLRFARSVRLGARRFILAAHGSGMRLAAQACEVAWNRCRPQALASVGFCGALSSELGLAGVLAASEVIDAERGRRFSASLPQCRLPHRQGPVVSVDRVVGSAEEKSRLAVLGAIAVEMEAAAVAERARAWGVPFFCLKSVTDLAGETFTLDLNRARDPEGRLTDARVLRAALENPRTQFPELYQLYRRSRAAAKSLGDFLAACEF
jgi:nucleoside phosphorylase